LPKWFDINVQKAEQQVRMLDIIQLANV